LENDMAEQLLQNAARETAVTASGPPGPTQSESTAPCAMPPHLGVIARDGPQAERFAGLLQRGFVPSKCVRRALAGGSAQFLLDVFVQPIGDSLTGPDDSGRPGIMDALAEAAVVLSHRGSVGIDFSALRPKGARVGGSNGCRAAGPAAYLRLFEQLHHTVRGPAAARGAVTATLRIDHPDILTFLRSPTTGGVRRCIAVSDAFMQALGDDTDFDLAAGRVAFADVAGNGARTSGRAKSGMPGPVDARAYWHDILRKACDKTVGIAFIDSARSRGGCAVDTPLTPVLPAGPLLPPHGTVAHGTLNLPAFVTRVDEVRPRFDWNAFGESVGAAVEFLDRVLDITGCPRPQQEVEMRNTRPVGLACRGLHDTLQALSLRADDESGNAFVQRLWSALRDGAFMASSQLARAHGAFPLFDADRFLDTGFGVTLRPVLKDAIRRHGIRNSRLLSAWLADDRGRNGMNIEERMRTLATVAPLVDGGVALPIRVPRDSSIEALADLMVGAWLMGATCVLLHR
jgi:ribonucleoside-diphosphate reductase alpha chain